MADDDEDNSKRGSKRGWVLSIVLALLTGPIGIGIFNRINPEPKPQHSGIPDAGHDRRRAAEAIGVEYVTALLRLDVDTLTARASVPFFLDDRVLLSKSDIRKRYEDQFRSARSNDDDVNIISVKTKTLGEWKDEGFDPSRDRLLKSITLADDNYIVVVTTPHDGIGIFTRQVGGDLTVAGFWD
jgi:hypothetical protein